MRPGGRAAATLLGVLGAVSACLGPSDAEGVVPEVATLDDAAWSARDAARLELARAVALEQGDEVERFWASGLAAELHALASEEPFWSEPAPAGPRPSPTAHLVAAAALAERALELGPAVRGVPVPLALRVADAPLPDDHATRLRELQLLRAIVLERLGLPSELESLAGAPPGGVDAAPLVAWLEGMPLRRSLRPWLAALLSRRLRSEEPRTAYRLAILAIEGEPRYGRDLPAAEVQELEAWILEGAPVRFVCPDSRTTYVPGQRQSPISGLPHLDYEAVERP